MICEFQPPWPNREGLFQGIGVLRIFGGNLEANIGCGRKGDGVE